MLGNERDPEVISLSLPANAAYVSAARLTASSVSGRMGFDIDEVEDIKSAVSEACTFIIKKLLASKVSGPAAVFDLKFYLAGDIIRATISTKCFIECSAIDDNDAMELTVIKALVDELSFDSVNDSFNLTMVKRHSGMSL